MNKIMTMSAAFALATTISVGSATAATFIQDGETHAVGAGENEFFGDVNAGAAGGAGSWMVRFNSAQDPLNGSALATIGPVVSNQFQNLVMSWVTIGNNVLSSVSIVPSSVTLGTTFAGANIDQYLQISWTGSSSNASFDVEVSTVPLPAGLVLLLSGLMGLGFLGRSRKAA